VGLPDGFFDGQAALRTGGRGWYGGGLQSTVLYQDTYPDGHRYTHNNCDADQYGYRDRDPYGD
jgi:hypothetical protein